MTACADKLLLLHALVDNELDIGAVAALEGHLATCPGCSEELGQVRSLKTLLAEPEFRHAPPDSWRERVSAAIPAGAGSARPRRAAPWLAGGSIVALAASLALFALLPQPGATLTQELVEGHIRSLQAQHLVDVQTSDRHVVKPWFNGKIDFAPPVIDLAASGYPLAGGRLDYIEGRTVAALVYRRRAHVINLFVWPGRAPAIPEIEHRQGYTLIRWGRGGLVYWAVSDIDSPDLNAFQRQYVAATPS